MFQKAFHTLFSACQYPEELHLEEPLWGMLEEAETGPVPLYF